MVLRLALYLVERGFYEKVQFVFLVVGHTKNPCDRMYNILKKLYRQSNVYTFSQLLVLLNDNEGTTAYGISEDDFRNWDKTLDLLYRRFHRGTVHKGHVFSVEKESPTKIVIEICRRPEDANATVTREMKKRGTDNTRRQLLMSVPDVIVPPGIPEIKQIELGTKCRSHVPVSYQDDICPIPPDDLIKKMKKEKSEKAKQKRGARKTEKRSSSLVSPTDVTVAPAQSKESEQMKADSAAEEVGTYVATLRQSLNYQSIAGYRDTKEGAEGLL